MSNPEYENKVSPTELYNDEILEQFEAIRNVIHKEVLPSTYNELIVTSNQAGTLTSWMDWTTYPQSEIIFPLSPQSGNINWLEKNFLRFHFRFKETTLNQEGAANIFTAKFPTDPWKTSLSFAEVEPNSEYRVSIGPIDGSSIFKSVELNYGGTAIWTSAYQQVESFFTYASLPEQLTSASQQYWTWNKSSNCYLGNTGWLTSGTVLKNTQYEYDFYLDIDISRLSPILSWLSIIPSFVNKLNLRVVLDAPQNWLVRRIETAPRNLFLDGNNTVYGTSATPLMSRFYPLVNDSINTNWSYNLQWCVDLCEVHQNNATMTEDTRIRLIALIQQLGGKWIYPCRYWNTAIAPIQQFTDNATINLQFVLTGCYFRALAFTMLPYVDNNIHWSPGLGIFTFPYVKNIEMFCDSELLVQYPIWCDACTDTNSALMDNDKYTIPRDVIQSCIASNPEIQLGRSVIVKATGPPNGMYSGKYTSEKMGTHNILLKFTTYNFARNYSLYAWCSALMDGVIVFDNFNGSYFATGRKMQQVYEALT